MNISELSTTQAPRDKIPRSRTRSRIKTLVLIASAALITAACKNTGIQPSGSVSLPPSGGMPGGGMPSPPGGGMPSPPGSGSPSPSGSGTSSPSGGGMPSPSGGGTSSPSGGGMPSPGGSTSGQSSGSGGAGGAGGDVGAIPPPPSERGAGGAGGDGESGSESDPFGDADGDADSECGNTGAIPGGIGGMGQAGECLGEGSGSGASDGSAASDGESTTGAADSGGGGAGSVGQFPEESAEERAARLGRELEESIGGFDEALQEEQQEIAAVGRVLEGYDTEGAGGQSGGLIGLGTQTGARGRPEGGSVGGQRPDGPPEIDGMTQAQIEERTPDDVPIGVDDDIIARQLREAALTEDDPALRERLWEEYRKYKGISARN